MWYAMVKNVIAIRGIVEGQLREMLVEFTAFVIHLSCSSNPIQIISHNCHNQNYRYFNSDLSHI